MAPHLSMLPSPSVAGVWGGASDIVMALDQGRVEYLASGRLALREALRTVCGEGEDEVLVPAYHCMSMVDAVHAVPAAPVYYRMQDDLSPDLTDLAALIGPRTRALIVVHFFGRPQTLAAIKKMCAGMRVAIVEDCAHTLFGAAGGVPVGGGGDIAVASLRKFFPTFDGGAIIDRRGGIRRRAAHTPRHELRAAYNSLVSALPVTRNGKGNTQGAQAAADAPTETDLDGGYLDSRFTFDEPGRAMSWAARLIMALTSSRRMALRRRAAYDALSAHFTSARGIRAFWPDGLSPDQVPYVFPLLLLDDPDATYQAIKARGIPAYRWDKLATSRCSRANDYAHRLIQLPCHQQLRSADLSRIAQAVTSSAARMRPNGGDAR